MLAGTVLGIDIFRTLESRQTSQKEEGDERLMHSQWFCLRNCLRAAIGSYLCVLHLHLFILAGSFIQNDVEAECNPKSVSLAAQKILQGFLGDSSNR